MGDDEANPASPDKYSTTRTPRLLVHKGREVATMLHS